MPSCVSCRCRVRRKKNKCMNCFADPPRPGDVCGDDRCIDCDVPLCLLHATQLQLRHGLCTECLSQREVREFYSSSEEEEGVQLDTPSVQDWWYEPFEEEGGEEEEHVSKRVKHTVVSHAGEGNDDCTICHEAMSKDTYVVTLPCFGKHLFHTECIEHWFDTQRQTCPLCNTQVNVTIAVC